MRVLCAILFLISLSGFATAQPYRQLSSEDFQGRPESDGATVAATACFIDLKYDVHARNGYYQLAFYVTLELNREKSWIDRSRVNNPAMLAEILKHEQGHYTINYFEQQELLRTFAKTRFDENIKRK